MCSLLICESLPVQSCVRPHQIAAVAIVPVVVGLAHVPHSLVLIEYGSWLFQSSGIDGVGGKARTRQAKY